MGGFYSLVLVAEEKMVTKLYQAWSPELILVALYTIFRRRLAQARPGNDRKLSKLKL
jgi:hypothetical protein